MKLLYSKYPILLLILISNIKIFSQTSASLGVNNISATFNSCGDLYSSPPTFTNGIQATIDNPTPIFSIGQLWIGGLDQSGQLHVAGQTYRQTGTDFWAGPLDTNLASIAPAVSAQWDRVWEISKSTIDSFQLGLFAQIPLTILNWPANGNSANGQAQILAPFVDVNSNGIYEPTSGDYPTIRGDKAVYFIFNDNLQSSTHGETAGLPFGIEIHGMAYAFDCSQDSALMNTIFLHYTIINRSTNTYSNCFIGHWLDIDLSSNDFVGTDSINNLCYFYNYGNDAIGFSFLNHQLTNSMAYNNTFSNVGNPTGAQDYYDYMQSIFTDSIHLTFGGSGYGGTQSVNHHFTGNPANMTGWLDTIAGSDKRIVGSFGSFNLIPGVPFSFDLALIHARDYTGSGQFQSTQIIKNRAAQIQNYYSIDTALCGGITSIPNTITLEPEYLFYPNPSNGEFILKGNFPSGAKLEIVDLLGQCVSAIEIPQGNQNFPISLLLADGVYLIQVRGGETILKSQKIAIVH